MLPEINAVSGTEKESELIKPSIEHFEIAELPFLETSNPIEKPFLSLPIERIQPFKIRAVARSIAENEDFIVARFEQKDLRVILQCVNYT